MARNVAALFKATALTLRIKIMTNETFGLIVIAISLAFFAATLIFGAALLAGHVALAILCACMFGMGIGVSIIERA
jgi:hypothetical protein